MKRHYLALLILLLACHTSLANQRIPRPPFEARIFVSQPTPYLKQTFTIRLEIVTRDVDIDQEMELVNLPDESLLSIFTAFEPLAVNRERIDGVEITRRRYRAQARALQTGPLEIAPSLQVKVRRRVRSMFGSVIEEVPISQPVRPVSIEVRHLPPPPDDFAGIIGVFDFQIYAEPLEIAEGDLVTIHTEITGEGWVDANRIPKVPSSPLLRAYRLQPHTPPQPPGTFRFTQTVIPLSREISQIPPLAFSWFNTEEETYQSFEAGPFALTYREPKTRVIKLAPVRESADVPAEPARLSRNQATTSTRIQARLAPASASLVIFEIPAHARISILERHDYWSLVQSDSNRGWIPSSALELPRN